MRRIFVPIVVLFLLCSCILVDDFGAAWSEAKPDICLSKIAESLYYTELRRDATGKDMGQLARGWVLNGHDYLLLKKDPSDKGGRLYRFQVTSGIFQRYRLNPTMREQFAKDYPNAAVSLKRDTVTIADLSPSTRKLLDDVAARPEYWEVEDQALYNPLRNPLCRFDDRDLKHMKD